MRTPRTTLIQTLKSRWQGTDLLSASVSSTVLAGLLLVGLGLTHPLAQATEIEVNSLSEERRIMDDETSRPVTRPDDAAPALEAETVEPPADTLPEAQDQPRGVKPKASPPAANSAPSNAASADPISTDPISTDPISKDPAAATPASKDPAAGKTAPDLPLKDSELPRAKSVDLAKPITTEELKTPSAKTPSTTDANDKPGAAAKPAPEGAAAKSAPTPAYPQQPAADKDLPQTGTGEVATPEPSAPSRTAEPQTPDASSAAEVKDRESQATDTQSLSPDTSDTAAAAATPPIALPEPKPVQPKSLLILGTEVPPSTSTRLAWSPSQSFEGLSMPTPVLVVNGAKDGPTVCLTAAIHGDELNGIEVVRRVLYGLNPKELTGAVIGVPIVNLQGFRRGSRYLTDRRDLNRYFPGNPDGSSGARIAHSFFHSVIRHCNVLVDLHTGSFDRINLPQVRADLRDPGSARLTQNFGATVVLHSTGADGTLRRAAAEYGIPAVTLEAGGPMRLEEANVSHGVAAIRTLLNSMGMIKKFSFWGKPEPVYYQSSWIRVNHGGILFSTVDLGQKVKTGDVLGTVTDPITNVRHPIISTHDGRVIGMALNQVMLPGYAAYHIGIAAKDEINAVPADDSLLMNDIDLSLSDEELTELTAKVIAH